MPLPHSLLQPSLFPPAFLAPLFPPNGPLAWLIRLVRLSYTLFFSFPLILFSSLFPSLHLLPTFPNRDKSTSTVVPLVASLIWSATWGFLSPPKIDHLGEGATVQAREEGPKMSLWLFGGGEGVKVKGVEVEKAGEEWCRGVVRDGFGLVRRRRVGGSWLWRDDQLKDKGRKREGDGRAVTGEKVVMYVVGGGYVSGDALLGPFIFNLLHSSPKNPRFFTVEYRLAQHPSTSFPAALQDLLAAWIYLTKEKGFRPEDVTLAGDSAGAGAIWSLVSYLGVLSEEEGGDGVAGLGMPGKVALFSPWSDLTLSHPTHLSNVPFDILNRAQCVTAASFYLRNLDSPGPSPPSSARKSTEDITSAAQLLERGSFDRLGAAHPIFSPSALAHHQHVHAHAGKNEEDELVDASTCAPIESAATSHDPHPFGTSHSSPAPTSSSPSDYHSIISSGRSSSSNYLSPTSSPSSGSSTPSPSLKHSPTHPTPPSPSPHTSHILSLLLSPILKAKTKFFIHSGSSELFASEISLLVASLRAANIPVWNVVEDGLCHGGAQSFPMAKDGTGKSWKGKAARKAGRAFGCWLEGGGGREGGGEGWVWGD